MTETFVGMLFAERALATATDAVQMLETSPGRAGAIRALRRMHEALILMKDAYGAALLKLAEHQLAIDDEKES